MMNLYDLAGYHDDLRFSPYCWRIKLALAHKGISVDCRPWRFTEKNQIEFSNQKKVSVLVDGAQIIHDSWTILNYLDTAYSDKPLLFADEAAMLSLFNNLAGSAPRAHIKSLNVLKTRQEDNS